MRMLPLIHIKENEKLGCNIYDVDHRLLLGQGVTISPSNKQRLMEGGYASVYISDTHSQDRPQPVVDFELQNKSVAIVKKAFEAFKALMALKNQAPSPSHGFKLKKAMDLRDQEISNIVAMTDKIIYAISTSSVSKFEYIHPKNLYNYSYQHAINTGILSILIGKHMQRNINEIKSLFLASILCEMGNLTIPQDILLKKEKLLDVEYEIVKRHCQDSYQEIKTCPELNHIIKTICLQHHERVDGSGYPMGLHGQDINLLAKIVGVADAYDALTSDRSYRFAYSAYEALQVMEKDRARYYDPSVFDSLLAVVEPLPIGTIMTLNDTFTCIVMAPSKDHPLRPLVKVLGQDLDKQMINMADHPQLKITGMPYNVK